MVMKIDRAGQVGGEPIDRSEMSRDTFCHFKVARPLQSCGLTTGLCQQPARETKTRTPNIEMKGGLTKRDEVTPQSTKVDFDISRGEKVHAIIPIGSSLVTDHPSTG